MTATDYKDLLYKVAQELRRDPEVDMGRLKFIAEDKMSPERVAEIHDELSWIKELDASGSIRMDNLDYLKEILQTLEKRACLGKVLSFETKRRSATLAFQPTGSSGAIVRAFAGRLLGALDIKCVYRVAGFGVLAGGTAYILKHCQANRNLVDMFQRCALPVGITFLDMSKGCVCLEVQAESLSALRALWQKYEDGSLQKALQDLLVTEGIKEMADGKDVELRVIIDEDLYRNVCLDLLILETQEVTQVPARRRRMSDSFLLVKSPDDSPLFPPDRRRLQMAKLVAESERARRELLEKELDKLTQQHEDKDDELKRSRDDDLAEYLEKLELARSSSGATESDYRTEASSAVDPAELEEGKSGTYGAPELMLSDLPGGFLTELADAFSADSIVAEFMLEAFGLPAARTSYFKGAVDIMVEVLRTHSSTPVRVIRDVCASLLGDDSQLVKRLDQHLTSSKPSQVLHPVLPSQGLKKMYEERVQRQPVTHIDKVRFLVENSPALRDWEQRLLEFFQGLGLMGHDDVWCSGDRYRERTRISQWLLQNQEPCLYVVFLGRQTQWLPDFGGNPVLLFGTGKPRPRLRSEFGKAMVELMMPVRACLVQPLLGIIEQHWRTEDLWSMVKRYKASNENVRIKSCLTTRVMLRASGKQSQQASAH